MTVVSRVQVLPVFRSARPPHRSTTMRPAENDGDARADLLAQREVLGEGIANRREPGIAGSFDARRVARHASNRRRTSAVAMQYESAPQSSSTKTCSGARAGHVPVINGRMISTA